jgi:hypothetical protein
MEYYMRKWTVLFLSILATAQVEAAAVEVIGTIPVVISSDKLNTSTLKQVKEQQTVFVQKIRLSPEAQKILKERLENLSIDRSEHAISAANNIPDKVNLGMNATPVLDQGVHGSCVTFAMTGALDAVLGKGDYISQLCSLELGDYLQRQGKIEYSGWDGSFGSIVLNQLQDYGIVSKAYQNEFGCAGVKKYPVNNEKNTGKPMSISEYSANSSALSEFATWETLVDVEESFSRNHNPIALLRAVKKNLREGKRITFGMLLDESFGHAGALGTLQKSFDTWVLTPEIIKNAKDGKIQAGHEMIIIGYDDKAEVRTKNGKISKGVFILRNSWGKEVGHGGNFYISYEYFKALSNEAQVIIPSV